MVRTLITLALSFPVMSLPTPRRCSSRALLAAIAATLTGLAIGCTADPGISVVGVEPVQRTDDAVVLAVTVEGANTNDIELPFRTVRYSFDLDGRTVFTGERSPEATLRRRGAQRFVLPVTVPASVVSAAPGARPYRLSGTIGYVAPGQLAEVLFDLGVSNPTVAFSASGEVDLSAPVVPPPKPRPFVFTRPPGFEPEQRK